MDEQQLALGVDLWTATAAVREGNRTVRADVAAADYWRPVLQHLDGLQAAVDERRRDR